MPGDQWGFGSSPSGVDLPDVEPRDDQTAVITPARLAALVSGLARPSVLGFDLDGTLAPLVAHPSASRLLPGVGPALETVVAVPGVVVAVVSGRSWRDLDHQFDLPPGVIAVGSHGLERGRPGLELDPDERRRSARLAMIAASAAARAPGAWVEHKPAGLALHVRQAPAAHRRATLDWFVDRVAALHPAAVVPGHDVVDVAMRPYDKGAAIEWLREATGARSVVFVGDDVTDEQAFARLGPDDVGVKVGDGPTGASHRVLDPLDVEEFLVALARRLDPTGRAGR